MLASYREMLIILADKTAIIFLRISFCLNKFILQSMLRVDKLPHICCFLIYIMHRLRIILYD